MSIAITLKAEIVAGQNETVDDTVPVTGMVTGDRLVAVFMLTGGTTLANERRLDFAPVADNMTATNNKIDTTGKKYLIIWEDVSL